jgi:hypothetical protein
MISRKISSSTGVHTLFVWAYQSVLYGPSQSVVRGELTGVLEGDSLDFFTGIFLFGDLISSKSFSFSSSEISGFNSYSLELPESEGGDRLTIV